MHKNTLWLIVALLCIYFSLVLCEQDVTALQQLESEDSRVKLSDSTDLEEEARTRRRHRYHLWHTWGLYGLAIAYLVKIKVVVVAFFVGSAIYLGLRYLWPHRCGSLSGIYKEGDIVLDHPPYLSRSFHHHDHIPYALEHDHYHNHHFDTSSFSSISGPSWSGSSSGPSWSSSSSGPSSFGPYSAYSSHSFTESEDGPEGPPDGPDGPPDGITLDSPPSSFRIKRNVAMKTKEEVKKDDSSSWENLARQMVVTEERIGEFMFDFLGLDTPACRRRFICEMEFKSKRNPLTAMGFRIIGRSFFAKYTNDKNPVRKAENFGECAAVNAECVFIENNEDQEPAHENQSEDHTEDQPESQDDKTEATTENNSLESNDIIEQANEENLKEELRRNSYRRRLRGDRSLKLI